MTMEMVNKNILFYLFSVNGRGQSKVLIEIAAGLADVGYQVIFCCARLDDPVFINRYREKIRVVVFNSASRIISAWKLKKLVDNVKADILITGGTDNNCIAVMVSKLSAWKPVTIISEHTSLLQTVKNSKRVASKILPAAARWFYPNADVLVSVSNSLNNELLKNIKVKCANTKVLYNPVINSDLNKKSLDDVQHKWLKNNDNKVFLGVGQITEQKDFFLLINAFSLLKENNSFKLIILGDGPDTQKLSVHIKDLDLTDQVDLVGRVNNPYAYMRQADVFVLSSKWEGLPTVLIEALACGVPVVSTDCPHGPREILENGKWGDLVPVGDSDALAKAMLKAVNKPKGTSYERAKEFTHEASIKQYVELIESLS